MKNDKFTINNHITIEPSLIAFSEITDFIKDWDLSGVKIDIWRESLFFGADFLQIDVFSEPTENEALNRGFISTLKESIQKHFGSDVCTHAYSDGSIWFSIKDFFKGQHKPMDKEFVLRVLEEARSQQLTEPQVSLA